MVDDIEIKQVQPEYPEYYQNALENYNRANAPESDALPEERISNLRETLVWLGEDQSPEAIDLRRKAGSLWIDFCVNEENLAMCKHYIEEGSYLFTYVPVTHRLNQMYDSLQRWEKADAALKASPGKQYPTWFSERSGRKFLAQHINTLDRLAAIDNWKILRDSAIERGKLLLNTMLPAFLFELTNKAAALSREYKFAESLKVIEKATTFVPESAIANLPKDLVEERIQKFNTDLISRQKAEVKLWKVALSITKGEPFSKVVPDIRLQIPENDYIPVDDLEDLMSDFNLAIEIENTLRSFNEADSSVSHLEQWLMKKKDVSFNTVEKMPSFLQQSDTQTAHRLLKIFFAMQDRLNNILKYTTQEIINNVKKAGSFQNAEEDVETLINAYWQLVWIDTSGELGDKDLVREVQNTIDYARNTPADLVKIAFDSFTSIDSDENVMKTTTYLSSLLHLNKGLVDLDSATGSSQLIWKSITEENRHAFAKRPTYYESAPIERWINVLEPWVEEGEELVEETTLDDVIKRSWSLQRDFVVLKKDILPLLSLPIWGERSMIGMLEKETSVHNEIVQAIKKARKMEEDLDNGKQISSIDSLIFFDDELGFEEFLRKQRRFKVWLLESQQTFLVKQVKQLRARAIESTPSHLLSISNQSPNPEEEIKENVLLKINKRLTASVIIEATKSILDSAKENGVKRKEKRAAEKFRKAAHSATEPWVNLKLVDSVYSGVPTDIQQTWNQLHTLTEKTSLKSVVFGWRQEVFIIIAAILILGIGGVGVWNWVITPLSDANQAAKSQQLTATSDYMLTEVANLAAAQSTESAATITSQAAIIQATKDALYASETAQSLLDATSTQQVLIAHMGTSTAAAQATTTAQEVLAQAQTATAIASDPSLQATNEAVRCQDPTLYTVDVAPQPVYDPEFGSRIYSNVRAFYVSVTWIITNTGSCSWESMDIIPLGETVDHRLVYLKDGEPVEVTADSPILPNEVVHVELEFLSYLLARVTPEWQIIINGMENDSIPLLTFENQGWIVWLRPLSTNTPVPTSTPKPNKPAPPSRP